MGQTRELGRPIQWAIRQRPGDLIGGVGFHDLPLGRTHKAEIGYWLAKPYWGRGIMPEVVQRVCEVGFVELHLIRIFAYVFSSNERSSRVLEKCGFHLEGILRKNICKDGRFLDEKLFALIR